MSVNVLLPARMRWDGAWVSARVTAIGARELGIAVNQPPPVRAYVEVRVGDDTITACVTEVGHENCVLSTRERIDVAGFLGTRSSSSSMQSPNANASFLARAPCVAATSRLTAERSRSIGSAMQYLTAAAVAVSAAGSLSWEVYKTLSAPFKTIEAKLSPGMVTDDK